ncbi:putative inorganic phosphate cotransporter isoform X2 [Vanessa cardui]|uniref:putative inorganic phosphate cotransporter isoform X2 n=1 Tax=Vanessa cardui TaxID=171605 RepID=UPI001F145043|nr:putative inorganic phosphate cotransporter isoform X2 [Vanessa cardui]
MKISSKDSEKNYGYGVRHIQMLCMCLNMIALFIARGSLGVAVLAMTDTGKRTNPNVTVYEWDKKIQGLILSSFFWGYTAMQIPAGLLSKRYGGKPILLFSLLANAIICALLPTLVHYGGWQIVCACRVLMGLTQACLFPASHTLLGKWLPAQERTSYTGMVYGGTQMGIIIAMPVSGVLAETQMGWKLIFYTVSCIMFVTAAIWAFFSANSPRDHRLMTNEEREYIERGLNVANSKVLRTPWKQIFTTKALWAIMLSHFGCAIGFVLFFVDMPTYLERGLQISLKNSASLSALPYMGMLFGNVVSTSICEKLYNRGYLSLLNCRKLFNSIGFIGMAIGLLVLSFIGPDNKNIAVVTLIVALTLSGFWSAGFMMAHLDLSPNYGGVMLSITNFVANFGSIITPIVTSLILRNDPTDVSRWRIVFIVTAVVTIISNTGFVLFGSSERQEWDDPDYLDKRKADIEEMMPALTPVKDEKDCKENEK